MNKAAHSDVMTLGEAAKYVRVSEKTMRDLARENRVPGQKVGREWRFLRSAIDTWLAKGRYADAVAEPASQYLLPVQKKATEKASGTGASNGLVDTAFTRNRNQPLHQWVPWIAGFSSTFVGSVLESASDRDPEEVVVLDPFSGVGTTLVEGIERGHNAVGFEINPYAALVCRVKVQSPYYDTTKLRRLSTEFQKYMRSHVDAEPVNTPPANFRSRVPFFSPSIEPQVLHVLDFASTQHEVWLQDILRVALGAVMVSFSNYSYEPSLGTRAAAGKDDVQQADVAAIVASKLEEMIRDIAQLQLRIASFEHRPKADVYQESYLGSHTNVAPRSVDYLITSPPYLNNYHYIRNTRPHLYWLGLVESPSDLKSMETASFGKYWQTVRSGPVVDLKVDDPELATQIDRLRGRNTEKGVYGGAGWANYAATYFNDCLAFCRRSYELMKPGGTVVVVIGNNVLQGLEFKTDEHFAHIAESCGFAVEALHRVRKKRTGSSIIGSAVRVGNAKQRVELYETAVELRA